MQESSLHLSENLPQLIQACCRGDRTAQTALYRLFCNKMMGVCLWYAKNREEAEEILQDGFVQVFTHMGQYSGEGALEGWIRKIMVNAALGRYRVKKNNLMMFVALDPDEHDTTDHTASLTCHLDEKELLKQVQSLPPVYRMVFNLYVFEGLKHKEIAERMGISEGTSKSNLSDARAILQKKVNILNRAANG